MLIAEITVVPIGTGTPSVSRYVAKAVDELRKLGLNPELTAMGTIFEAEEISRILAAFKVVHESVFAQGAVRVVTTLTTDERRDKEGSIKQKVRSVTSGLEYRWSRVTSRLLNSRFISLVCLHEIHF